MKGKGLIIAIAVIVILALCALFAANFISVQNDDGTSSDLSEKVHNKVSQSLDEGSSSGSKLVDGLEKVYNGQADDGSYLYEERSDDGNVRQYDENGNLVGSTYEEDQAKLGNTNGDLE